MRYIAWLFPYFVIGFFIKERNLDIELFRLKNIIFPVLVVLFVVLLMGYTKDSFIYTTGTCIVKGGLSRSQLWVDLFRFTIGLLGAVAMMLLIRYFLEHLNLRLLPVLGYYSMGIYCFQDVCLRVWYHISRDYASPDAISVLIGFISVLLLTFLLSVFTKKVKLLNLVAFGGRK